MRRRCNHIHIHSHHHHHHSDSNNEHHKPETTECIASQLDTMRSRSLLRWWLVALCINLGDHEVWGFARVGHNQGRQLTKPKHIAGGRGRSNGRSAALSSSASSSSSSSASAPSLNGDVDELLRLLQGGAGSSYSKKTPEERRRILELMEALEARGAECCYLDDEAYVGGEENIDEVGGSLLWDSYELAYFDRSIDGGRGSGADGADDGASAKEGNVDQYKNATRPFGIRSKLLGKLFGLRYSFQHVVRPGRAVNDVGVKILGVPVSVIAGGNFALVAQEEVESVRNETGTRLREDTAVRIDFEEPVLWLGPKRLPLVFGLGSKARSPPVTLCTTYMDDRVRLALAAKGGRLVFTRGGKTDEAFARDWTTIEGRRPNGGRVVGTTAAVAAAAAWGRFPSARASLTATAAIPVALILLSKAIGLLSRDGSAAGEGDDGGGDVPAGTPSAGDATTLSAAAAVTWGRLPPVRTSLKAAAAAWGRLPPVIRASLALILLSKAANLLSRKRSVDDDGGDAWIRDARKGISGPVSTPATAAGPAGDDGKTWIRDTREGIAGPEAQAAAAAGDALIELDETRDAWLGMVNDMIAADEGGGGAAEGEDAFGAFAEVE